MRYLPSRSRCLHSLCRCPFCALLLTDGMLLLVVSSVPLRYSAAWSLSDNAGGLGCVRHLRSLCLDSQPDLQLALVGGPTTTASRGPSTHERDPLLSWFPVLRGRGRHCLPESHRDARDLWNAVGLVDRQVAYALSGAVSAGRAWDRSLGRAASTQEGWTGPRRQPPTSPFPGAGHLRSWRSPSVRRAQDRALGSRPGRERTTWSPIPPKTAPATANTTPTPTSAPNQ
jgi:hypothetical protein